MNNTPPNDGSSEALRILRSLLAAQEYQNKLIAVLVQNQNEQKQRQDTQGNQCNVWKKENDALSKRCGKAIQIGNTIFTQLVEEIVSALEDLEETDLYETNFAVFELIDKYGPRFQQFGGMLQAIAQLGSQ